MSETKLSDVLFAAYKLVIGREGDVDTEDGSFATVDIAEILNLDTLLAHYFNLGSDDCRVKDVDTILTKLNTIDSYQELIATLTEQLAEVKAQSLKEGLLLGYKQCSVDIDQGQWTDDELECLNEYVDDIIYLHCRQEVL